MSNRIFTVSAVNRYVKALIEDDVFLEGIRVRGEISNFKRHGSGHWYFTLKDEYSGVNCVMFRAQCERQGFVPENGTGVVADCRASLYDKTGQYQLYVDRMEPVGAGALAIAFEKLKAKLENEGLFAESRKRAIPPYPRRVAVITSPSGAAVRDIIEIIGKRNPSIEIIVVPVLVQGGNAAPDIARAIADVNEAACADVIILGRGGGSLEDLQPFNEEAVARAVFGSGIPVISAVGHETDFTISDFAADLRSSTPSSAAAAVAWPHGVMVETARECARRMDEAVINKINSYREDYVVGLFNELDTAIRKTIESRTLLSDSLYTDLQRLSPLGILSRGYAFVSRKDGAPVSSSYMLHPGDYVDIAMRDGTLEAEIKGRAGGNIYGEKETRL